MLYNYIKIINTIVLTYWFYNYVEYLYHKLGHYKHKYNYIYILHKKHHGLHYPINNLLSKKYRSNYEGVYAYTPPSIIITFILYNLFQLNTFLLMMTEIFILAFINDYIHTQIHIENSWLERYNWFKENRKLHFIHHKKTYLNFTFGYGYTIDKIMNTYAISEN